ncbi:MAG: lipocalin-like domain-containing protein [Alphaproteobacteria bacterium]|nr:lipocalin-like domain-containing protein [Alphaproteobacteria bacterium]
MAHAISPDHPIVGTWQLVSFTENDIETGAVTHPMGERAKAAVIYTADGYVITLFTAEGRTPPLAPLSTDQEAVDLYRSMIAFAGRYELKGAKLVYHPEISWNEAWNGTTQERLYKVNPSRLEVSSVPAVSTLTGRTTVFSLVWERMP